MRTKSLTEFRLAGLDLMTMRTKNLTDFRLAGLDLMTMRMKKGFNRQNMTIYVLFCVFL